MVTTADGKSVKVHLSAKTQLMLSTPADASAIKPGSYVGATNMDQTDGSGVSSEVHVMTGEGGPRPGINVPWGGGAMMTNGVVSKVAKSAKGPQLEINYGTGSKQVVVPGTTPIVVLSNTSDRSLVKPGVRVLAAGKADADGAVDAAYMTITPAGAAHAGH
jgi:hypothetical protein